MRREKAYGASVNERWIRHLAQLYLALRAAFTAMEYYGPGFGIGTYSGDGTTE